VTEINIINQKKFVLLASALILLWRVVIKMKWQKNIKEVVFFFVSYASIVGSIGSTLIYLIFRVKKEVTYSPLK
jgi:hypothetical protein